MTKDKFIKKLLIANTIFILFMCALLISVIVIHKSKPELTKQRQQNMESSIEGKNNIKDLKSLNYKCIEVIKSCDEMSNNWARVLRTGIIVAIAFFIFNIALVYNEAKRSKLPD